VGVLWPGRLSSHDQCIGSVGPSGAAWIHATRPRGGQGRQCDRRSEQARDLRLTQPVCAGDDEPSTFSRSGPLCDRHQGDVVGRVNLFSDVIRYREDWRNLVARYCTSAFCWATGIASPAAAETAGEAATIPTANAATTRNV